MPRGKPFEKGNKAAVNRGPNKVSKTVKETVLTIFNQIQDDPNLNLLSFAKEFPKEFYALAAKLIPTELNANLNATISVEMDKEEIKKISDKLDESF